MDTNGRSQQLLTEEQLAELWQTNARHLRRLRATAALPFVRVGRLIRYDPADVDHWLATRKETPAA